MPEVSFKIKESFGILSEKETGWAKELNIVSWNDRDPKYDLRDWSPSHKRMGRGVTFSVEELTELKRILNKLPL